MNVHRVLNGKLAALTLLLAVVLAAAPLGIMGVQAEGESIAEIIQNEMSGSVTVTVDGTQYYIVTLNSYIDPETHETTPASNTVKVYTDTAYNPVSDETIAQKIAVIDFARRISQLEGLGTVDGLQATIDNMNKRLYYHYIIRFDEILLNASSKAIAIAIRGYVTAGTSIAADTISAAVDTTVSLVANPLNLVEGVVYLDFSSAEEEYQEAIDIVETGEITTYENGYDYVEHFLYGNAYQYPAFNPGTRYQEKRRRSVCIPRMRTASGGIAGEGPLAGQDIAAYL